MQPTRIEAVTATGTSPLLLSGALLIGGGALGYRTLTAGAGPMTVVALLLLAAAALLGRAGIRMRRTARRYRTRRAEVLAHGPRVEAVVTDVAQLREYHHGSPDLRITLRFRTPAGGTHNALVRYTVPVIMVAELRRGLRLPIIADVEDPFTGHTVVEWDQVRLPRTMGGGPTSGGPASGR